MKLLVVAPAFLTGCFLMYGEPPEYGEGPEVWSEPTEHLDDSWVFSTERINRLSLEIADDQMEILRAERLFSYPRNKARAQAVFDGEVIGDVGVRLRGGLGSFRPIDWKPKLEIDWNKYSGDRFHGLESISLNNFAADCSGLRETIAFAAYGLADVPTSRTGFVQLFVNGEDYGLMLVLETQDDRWLKRNFKSRHGNLYDGKYVYTGLWPAMVDFAADRDDWFDLEEGSDVGFSDIARISKGAHLARESGRISDDFRPLVDWDELTTFLAVERFTGNGDGYASGPNNYRVYFEPGQPLVIAPWDLDAALPTSGFWEEDGVVVDSADTGESSSQVMIETERWESPAGVLGHVCLEDPECAVLWEARKDEVWDLLLDGTLYDLGLEVDALIAEAIAGDPRLQDCEDEGSSTRLAIMDFLQTGAYTAVVSKEEDETEEGCNQAGRAPPPVWIALVSMLALLRRRLAAV